MFFSKRYKLLFIAIPKTGSTSIEAFLKTIDPNGSNHSITINGSILKGKDFEKGIIGHARAREIQSVVGIKNYEGLNSFTFVRNPYELLVSAYFFSKKNKIGHFKNFKGSKRIFRRKMGYFFSVLSAKMIPFQIWALLYPYKSSYNYIFDNNGKKLIKYIGRTDNLYGDLIEILNLMGIDISNQELQYLNKSSHKDISHYYNNRLFKYIIYKKIKRDLDLYENISSKYENLN